MAHFIPKRFIALAHFKSALIGLCSIGKMRFIAGVALLLLIIIAVSSFALQRRQSTRFSQLLDLHMAMDHWRQEPQAHADQLAHLCSLFRLHPHMLKRFGGEFLSSALLLRGKMGKEGADLTNWSIAQQKSWEVEAIPHFAKMTLMAIQGEYASLAKMSTPLPDASSISNSVQLPTGRDALMAYQLTRCAACSYLSRDQGLFEKAKKELLRAAGSWPVKKDCDGGEIQGPFAALFDCYQTGRLTLLDWVMSPD